MSGGPDLSPGALSPGATFPTRLGPVEIHRLLGRGKSGYSYLVQLGTEMCVLKRMHDEPVPYYTFGANKVDLEVQAYHRLVDLGVNVPSLLDHDQTRHYLLKPFVKGPVASEVIARDALPVASIHELLSWSARLRDQGVNLDWFPSNFVVTPTETVYIDYELNGYNDRWSFEEWGLLYWANSAGFRDFLATGDALHINTDLTTGVPRTTDASRQTLTRWLATVPTT